VGYWCTMKLALGRRTLRILFIAAFAVLCVLEVVTLMTAYATYRAAQWLALDPTGEALMVPRNERLEPPIPGQRRVVLIGDSRIARWTPALELTGCQVVNRGISGQTTAQVALRLERDALRLDPAVVVIQAGINDLKTIGLFPDAVEAITRNCHENLRSMIDRVRRAGVPVVVLTIFPVARPSSARLTIWSDATIDAVDATNRWLEGLNEPAVTIVRCDEALRQGRYIDPALATDMLHLNAAGYVAINPLVARALLQVLKSDAAQTAAPKR
jgi:lysophospholipase L1-like esterase